MTGSIGVNTLNLKRNIKFRLAGASDGMKTRKTLFVFLANVELRFLLFGHPVYGGYNEIFTRR